LSVAPWQGFYVMLGSSAATLIGLQFVVVALVSNMRKLATAATIHAFGTPTVAHLVSALIISAIMSAPWPSPVAVAVALVICGVVGLGYAVIVINRVRRQTGYEMDGQDWLWYAVVPCSLYVGLAVAGLTLPTTSHVAPFVVAGAALACCCSASATLGTPSHTSSLPEPRKAAGRSDRPSRRPHDRRRTSAARRRRPDASLA